MKPDRKFSPWIAAGVIGLAALGLAAAAGAQYPGEGYGPGMMHGHGWGMMGGHGRGMMGGYGPEPNGPDEENLRRAYPELNTQAGRVFTRTCSQCHVLPDPRQHTAAQWPAVVARMQLHMRERNVPPPGEGDVKQIDSFLAQYAYDRR